MVLLGCVLWFWINYETRERHESVLGFYMDGQDRQDCFCSGEGEPLINTNLH